MARQAIDPTALPVIVIGGPPHSGKSVLSYALTKALVDARVPHYLLRACPDGEGNWSQETTAPVVERIRRKGAFTDHFMDELCDDLAHRHLPLLLDVGGKISPEQERILAFGSAAILLASDLKGAEADDWREAFARHRLPILADITSRLRGTAHLAPIAPTHAAPAPTQLQGTLVGLERQKYVTDQAFDQLTDHVAATLAVPDAQLRAYHRQLAPAGTIWVEIDRIDDRGESVRARGDWEPAAIPPVLAALPTQQPLAIYGRGPGWLVAALAAHAQHAAVYAFDARLAWLPIPKLTSGEATHDQPLTCTVVPQAAHLRLEFAIVHHYLDYTVVAAYTPPRLDAERGIVISGKLPNWLVAALALAYRAHPWVAIYQPQLKGNAAIVHSRTPTHPIGTIIAAPAPEKTTPQT